MPSFLLVRKHKLVIVYEIPEQVKREMNSGYRLLLLPSIFYTKVLRNLVPEPGPLVNLSSDLILSTLIYVSFAYRDIQ